MKRRATPRKWKRHSINAKQENSTRTERNGSDFDGHWENHPGAPIHADGNGGGTECR